MTASRMLELGKSAPEPAIELLADGVWLRDVRIRSAAVSEFLREGSEEEREARLLRALEVGVFSLERASGTQDMEFLRHQVQDLVQGMTAAASSVPDAVEDGLLRKLGIEEGQALAPVRRLIELVSATLTGRIEAVRSLLDSDLDPTKGTSVLGRALVELRALLDPKQGDSIQGALQAAIREVTAVDGVVATSVQYIVAEALKPLVDEVNRLSLQIAGAEAATEVLQTTPRKGVPYEETVVAASREWGRGQGIEVHHVGVDNRPGDILLKVVAPGREAFTIVVETRDRTTPAGRKSITETLERAMKEREADAALFLSKSISGLAKEVGDWAEGECERGPFIATLHESLGIALRLIVSKLQYRAIRHSLPKSSVEAVEGNLQRMRTALKRFGTINRNVTQIRAGAEAIEDEAEALRLEIRRALSAIEDALHDGATT